MVADGTERFDTAEGLEHPEGGEIVWRDDLGVTCRRWNWRQGTRTRLTDASRRAFFVFDRLQGLEMAELDAATDELSAVLVRSPGCRVDRVVLAT